MWWGGRHRLCELVRGRTGKKEQEKQEKRGEENSVGRNVGGETDGTVVSVGLCTRTAKLVSLSPPYFYVRQCPWMQSDSYTQITFVAYRTK